MDPFRISVPEEEPVDDWSQGVPLAYLRDLCGYWVSEYSWRDTEARLNALPHFRTTVDGLGLHFVHARSPHPSAVPLVLTHGWPGSFLEFERLVPALTDPPDPADAFHVVCPSLPGYGFSDRPASTGWGIRRIARAWATLMADLGYERFGAAGSDWGTSVTTVLGQDDSPAGLCAWMVEKRLYRESFAEVGAWFNESTVDTVTTANTVNVPAGCSIFPAEMPRPSRRWASRRFTDIRHWGEPPRGDHFAAWEQPELFVSELRTFFRKVR